MQNGNSSEWTVNFLKSLLWVAVFAAILGGVALITEIIFVDFVHGNPHRSQQNAIAMIVIFTPIISLICAIGIMIVFTMPQCFQSISMAFLLRHFGRRGIYGIAILIPLAAVLSWYCYDYLTPTNFNLGINAGPEWTPYQHGLTPRRYLITLGIQIPITLFSLTQFHLQEQDRGRGRMLMYTILVVCTIVGAISGYASALNQYQFL